MMPTTVFFLHSTDITSNYDILWYIMIYYDLLWFIMIYYDILWFIMIYYDLLWYIMNYESCSKKLGLSSSLNLESRSHTVGEHVTIVSWLRASDRLSCRGCSLLHSLPICKVWRETVSTFFLVDSGSVHTSQTRVIKGLIDLIGFVLWLIDMAYEYL